MIVAVSRSAPDVCCAVAPSPTRITRAMTSIVGIIVTCASMVVAVTTVARWWRRRIPAPWTALCAQRLLQNGISLEMSPLEKGLVTCSCQVLMFSISSNKCTEFLANFCLDVRMVRDHVVRCDTFEELSLNTGAQFLCILGIACFCELIKHVFEGGCWI